MSVVYAVAGRQFIGSIVLICSTFLASLGGTGGGIVNVAIFFLIFGFPFHISAVLSICAICGNNLFQVAFNIDKRHPRSRNRPLIYWDAVLILLPAELAGSNVGVIVSKVVPDTIAYILTLIVLSFSGSLCLYEAIAILKKEFRKQEMEEAASLIANQDNSHNPDNHHNTMNFKDKKTNPNFSIMKDIVPDYMKRIIFFGNYIPPSENANSTPGSYNSVSSNNNHGGLENQNHSGLDNSLDVPWNEIGWIFATFFFYLICYIVMENFMNACTPAYFSLLMIMFAVIGIKYCWSYPYLIDKQRNDPDAFLEGDIYWSNLSSYLLPLAMMSIGALTAVLGTGGSELVAPLLLSMKVMPLVSSATVSIISTLNAFSSMLHFILLDQVPLRTGIIAFGLGAIGGSCGRITAMYITYKYGFASIIVFAQALILMIALCVNIYYIMTKPVDFSVGDFCHDEGMI